MLGDTTDGLGLVRDITKNLGWQIRAKRVLILGAGGAVRGVLEPLLAEQPQHVVIANRTVDKALQLSKGFAELGYILGCGFDMLPVRSLIWLSMAPAPACRVACRHCQMICCAARDCAACYDMMYARPADALYELGSPARRAGLQTVWVCWLSRLRSHFISGVIRPKT